MKSCPQCQRVFPDEAGFCPADGTALAAASIAPVARSDLDRRLGARLCGRYECRRVVADGGMGRVYEGIDKQINSRIAIKVLHDQVASDEVALERFKREYEISARLRHEHIVRVFDFQRDAVLGTWLLVMEFLDGEELRYVLKRERVLAPERLVRMLSQIAIGLDDAHARGLIHRDLKPDNLFLCGRREGDIVKILDFGSVKDTSEAADRKKLTVLGTTIGSPYYMAPEQAQGLETLDPRADVFALAAVAYECLTGEVPFVGTNGPSILLAILTKDPDPPSVKMRRSERPVPASVDAVLEQGLAKNPNIRTPSVGALADDLGHAFGLEGNHLQWAVTSQQDLGRRIAAALPSLLPVRAAFDIVADPFAPAVSPIAERSAAAPAPKTAGLPSSERTAAGALADRSSSVATAPVAAPSALPPGVHPPVGRAPVAQPPVSPPPARSAGAASSAARVPAVRPAAAPPAAADVPAFRRPAASSSSEHAAADRPGAAPAAGRAADPWSAARPSAVLPVIRPAVPGARVAPFGSEPLPDEAAFGTSRRIGAGARDLPVVRPGWLLPVIVGVLALVLGGAVTLAVLGH